MTDKQFNKGDRVRVRQQYAGDYIQPFRRLIQAGRVATVLTPMDGRGHAYIQFDAGRKGARRQTLSAITRERLEHVDD